MNLIFASCVHVYMWIHEAEVNKKERRKTQQNLDSKVVVLVPSLLAVCLLEKTFSFLCVLHRKAGKPSSSAYCSMSYHLSVGFQGWVWKMRKKNSFWWCQLQQSPGVCLSGQYLLRIPQLGNEGEFHNIRSIWEVRTWSFEKVATFLLYLADKVIQLGSSPGFCLDAHGNQWNPFGSIIVSV